MKSWIKRNLFRVMVAVVVILLVIMVGLSFGKNYQNNTIEKETVTQEEVKRYEVLNVKQYVQNETDGYGNITKSYIAYTFMYLDDNKDIKTVSDFEDLQYGSERLEFIDGDTDYYYEDNGIRYLCLSSKTLSEMGMVENTGE